MSDRVVVKWIRGFDDPEQARFAERQLRKEQEWQARISSPYVAPVLDIGRHPKYGPYVVTPYYPSTLAQTLVAADYVPTLGFALRIAEQVLQGLVDCRRDAGLIHLDIKPANIGLDDRMNVRLIDFGLAKIITGGWASSTMSGYTLWYAPREQIRHEYKNWQSSACDVFSVCATLYTILTGQPPLVREAAAMNLLDPETGAPRTYDPRFWDLINEQSPTAPAVLVPTLPGPVSDLVVSGLDLQAGRRLPGRHLLEAQNALDSLQEVRRAVRRHDEMPVGPTRVMGAVRLPDGRPRPANPARLNLDTAAATIGDTGHDNGGDR